MKYIIYCILAFIAALLFLPETGSTEIRNQELLWAIAAVILIVLIIRFCKLAGLASKVKKSLKENKYQVLSTRFGFGKEEFTQLAQLMADCILRNKDVSEDVEKLRAAHTAMHYCFNDAEFEEAMGGFLGQIGL